VAGVSIRKATADDAAFLALAMQEADRGHTGIGSWDVMFPGADEDRLHLLARLASTLQLSYVHWSTFLVAELDQRPVATVAGYVPRAMTSDMFAAACREVLGAEADAALAKDEAWSRSYFMVKMPADALRVEWVYTAPDARGRGVSKTLLTRLLADARHQGLASAYVATYIGNEPAIATYRGAGFEEFAACRHADYERRFGSPGLVAFRRPLV